MTLEPGEAVAVFEVALRSAIREVLPNWQAKLGHEAVERLRAKQAEDQRKRNGSAVSSDLLDYTETTQLTRLVEANWESFKPVFQDLARLKVMFGLVTDYRNPAQHNRELLDFERELLSGSAQQVRNQIGIYRGTSGSTTRFYPVIESAVDERGRAGATSYGDSFSKSIERYEIGDEIVIRARAASARSNENQWSVYVVPHLDVGMVPLRSRPQDAVATGDEVVIRHTFSAADVGENRVVLIALTTPSKYHRHRGWMDDESMFRVSIDPPWDE